MEFIVRYSDFPESISQIDIPIDEDRRNVIRIDVDEDNPDADVVMIESIDDSISFSVVQTMSKPELRDYVQLLQKVLGQMR